MVNEKLLIALDPVTVELVDLNIHREHTSTGALGEDDSTIGPQLLAPDPGTQPERPARLKCTTQEFSYETEEPG